TAIPEGADGAESSCTILTQNNIVGDVLTTFGPSDTGTAWAIDAAANPLLAERNAHTFDVVGPNSQALTPNAFANYPATLCELSDENFPPGAYVRYYVTYRPAGSPSPNDRAIAVAVLWRDR